MVTILGSSSFNRRLAKAAAGTDVTKHLLKGALLTQQDFVEALNKIEGSRKETRYDPTRVVIVSDPGTAPNSDRGQLANSSGVRSDRKNHAEVFVSAEYAEALELGTDKIAPRPALAPAFARNREKVLANIRRAMKGSI